MQVHFQALQAWYRTLDRLTAAKRAIEVALYRRLRDLFSLQPDLVLYDIKREQAMERTRVAWAKLQRRVADGHLSDPAQIAAAATRALQAHHGYRYYRWEIREGLFYYEVDPVRLPQEKRLEGR